MDDILITSDTHSELVNVVREVLILLELGGFFGHKISSNSTLALEAIDQNRVERSKKIKLLGLILDHATNEFQFDLDDKFQEFDPDAKSITRRTILSLASQMFDICGFVSPHVMMFKTILPMLWHSKTGWDQNLRSRTIQDKQGNTIPDPVAQKAIELFTNWITQIPKLKELRFP
jgi:hypothetical protein